MKWIEIIEIRSLSRKNALLELDLTALIAELKGNEKPCRIGILRHGELETDWSIHLYYASDSSQANRSLFGARFASLLKEFGLVHHSVWKEVRSCESKTGE